MLTGTYYLLQTHITMDKNILRQEMIQRKRQFTAHSLRELSLAIITRLLAHPRVQTAQTIMLYHSLPDEVYTHDAIEQLSAAGKQVLLPAVLDEEHLELRPYQGENDLQLGAMQTAIGLGVAGDITTSFLYKCHKPTSWVSASIFKRWHTFPPVLPTYPCTK